MKFEDLRSSFPNYTEAMYEGNEPCGKGSETESGKLLDRWETKYGSGQTDGDTVYWFSFHINPTVTIYIVGNVLNIMENRQSSDLSEYTYCNNEAKAIHGAFREVCRKKLDKDKIERYLNTNIPNCKIWNIVQARAKELYEEWMSCQTT